MLARLVYRLVKVAVPLKKSMQSMISFLYPKTIIQQSKGFRFVCSNFPLKNESYSKALYLMRSDFSKAGLP